MTERLWQVWVGPMCLDGEWKGVVQIPEVRVFIVCGHHEEEDWIHSQDDAMECAIALEEKIVQGLGLDFEKAIEFEAPAGSSPMELERRGEEIPTIGDLLAMMLEEEK